MELRLKDKEKIALFIDADNAPAAKIDIILSELARYGVVNIRKAYGNWKAHVSSHGKMFFMNTPYNNLI